MPIGGDLVMARMSFINRLAVSWDIVDMYLY